MRVYNSDKYYEMDLTADILSENGIFESDNIYTMTYYVCVDIEKAIEIDHKLYVFIARQLGGFYNVPEAFLYEFIVKNKPCVAIKIYTEQNIEKYNLCCGLGDLYKTFSEAYVCELSKAEKETIHYYIDKIEKERKLEEYKSFEFID